MTSPAEKALADEIEELTAQIGQLQAQLRTREQALALLRGEGSGLGAARRRGRRTTHILDVLAERADGLTRPELAAELGMTGDEHLLSNALSYLARGDSPRVRRTEDGRWHLAR